MKTGLCSVGQQFCVLVNIFLYKNDGPQVGGGFQMGAFHGQPQTGVPVQPGVPGLQGVPLQTQPGQIHHGGLAHGQMHPGGLVHGQTQPGGLANPSLFDVNHMSNFGNFYGSMPPNYKKEYKEYLIKNYMSNHTVDYAKIALGRNDLDAVHINLPTFVTGQLHYLIHAILNNRLNSRDEMLTRLFHFKNTMEIVCNNSPQSEFNSRAWHLARAYDDKVIRDIDLGLL